MGGNRGFPEFNESTVLLGPTASQVSSTDPKDCLAFEFVVESQVLLELKAKVFTFVESRSHCIRAKFASESEQLFGQSINTLLGDMVPHNEFP